MSLPPPPPNLWQRFPLVCQDIEDGNALLDAHRPMPPRLLCALIWAWTDIPTGLMCRGGENRWSIGTELTGPTSKRVLYERLYVVCDRRGPWFAHVGIEQIRDWLHLVTPGTDRNEAWNQAHGVYRAGDGDAPAVVPSLVGARQKLADVGAESGRIAAQMALYPQRAPHPVVSPKIEQATESELEAELMRRRAARVGVSLETV